MENIHCAEMECACTLVSNHGEQIALLSSTQTYGGNQNDLQFGSTFAPIQANADDRENFFIVCLIATGIILFALLGFAIFGVGSA